MVDECADVISHQAYVYRSINIRGAAMALQVDGDDLVALGECRKDRTEHLAGTEPAMQQDQRPPGTNRFDIEIDAIDFGVLAGAFGVGRPIGRGHDAAPLLLALCCR